MALLQIDATWALQFSHRCKISLGDWTELLNCWTKTQQQLPWAICGCSFLPNSTSCSATGSSRASGSRRFSFEGWTICLLKNSRWSTDYRRQVLCQRSLLQDILIASVLGVLHSSQIAHRISAKWWMPSQTISRWKPMRFETPCTKPSVKTITRQWSAAFSKMWPGSHVLFQTWTSCGLTCSTQTAWRSRLPSISPAV